MSPQTQSWMLSLGVMPVPEHLYANIEKPIDDEFENRSKSKIRSQRQIIIDEMKKHYSNGITDYFVIKNRLIEDRIVSIEKFNDQGIYYISKKTLSMYLHTARKELNLTLISEKHKIIKLFDSGFSRSEIELLGFHKANVFHVLKTSKRIGRKNIIKEKTNGISQ